MGQHLRHKKIIQDINYFENGLHLAHCGGGLLRAAHLRRSLHCTVDHITCVLKKVVKSTRKFPLKAVSICLTSSVTV